jgi:hypothetical protein
MMMNTPLLRVQKHMTDDLYRVIVCSPETQTVFYIACGRTEDEALDIAFSWCEGQGCDMSEYRKQLVEMRSQKDAITIVPFYAQEEKRMI